MTPEKYYIQGTGLAQKFRRLTLFRDIDINLETGQSLALTGFNGSGKSTLLQILAGIRVPTRGTLTWGEEGGGLDVISFQRLLGFTSPLVRPYGECTGMENLEFVLGEAVSGEDTAALLQLFKLEGHEKKAVKTYSSGMEQRLKLISVLAKKSPFLFFDEPGTNLDRQGKDLLYEKISELKDNRVIIIATNEPEEVNLCGGVLNLGK